MVLPSQFWSGRSGGFLRDEYEYGNLVLGFSRKVGSTSSLSAKLWAIKDGLTLALNRGFSKPVLETDCQVAKILLNSKNNRFPPLTVILSDCRMFIWTRCMGCNSHKSFGKLCY
ncbi:hypothetical protein SLA2020_422870 [Shorea laevis]